MGDTMVASVSVTLAVADACPLSTPPAPSAPTLPNKPTQVYTDMQQAHNVCMHTFKFTHAHVLVPMLTRKL